MLCVVTAVRTHRLVCIQGLKQELEAQRKVIGQQDQLLRLQMQTLTGAGALASDARTCIIYKMLHQVPGVCQHNS